MEIVAIEGKAFEQLKQRFDDFTRKPFAGMVGILKNG